MTFEDLLHPWLEAYFRSPQWLKNTVGHTYASVAGRLRGRRYQTFAQEAALRDPVALRTLSEDKLRTTLQWALETVPAYAPYRHLSRSLETPLAVLAALPPMTKEMIRQDISRHVSSAMGPRHRLKVATGGSTAVPMQFYLQKGVTRAKEYAYIDAFQRTAGRAPTEVVLSLRGRAVPGAQRDAQRLWMFEPIKRELILSCDHMTPDQMPAYVQALRTWKPAFIQAYPSAIYPLARWLQQHPAPDVTSGIRSIMLFSENVLPHHRQVLDAVFGCPVLQHYGQSERILMAMSMPDDARYFFFPQYGHVELLDPAGAPVTTPGAIGEIVGTAFDNRVMPFIRYRTGDMAVLASAGSTHPALPGFPVLERIAGRSQEFLVCRDHRLIGLNSLTTPRYDELAEVEDLQFEQHLPGHFLIRIVTRAALSSQARRRLVQAMEEKTVGGCTAEVVEVDRIGRTARGKQRMLVQHLDVTRYFGAAPAVRS